jgi:hypothetical protein
LSLAPSDSPILDYAGPASRSALRLAAQSELSIEASPPRRLVVRERLAGQAGAVGALLLAAVAMIAMVNIEIDMAHKWRRNFQTMTFIAALMVAEVAVGAMVVNQTWRRTVLDVTCDAVNLTFASPFGRTTRLNWAAEQVAEVAVIDSPLLDARGGAAPELELRMWSGPPVRLFTGHRHAQLTFLANTIRAIQPPLPR